MPSTPSLWTGGLVEVELPSGTTIRGVLPHLAELARNGLIPSDLRSAALHFADPAWLSDEDPEETGKRQQEWTRLVRTLVARFPRDMLVSRDPDVWEPLGLTMDERVAAAGTPEQPGTMDPLDVDVLEDLVLRIRTAPQITAQARLLRGMLTAVEAAAVQEREASATVPGQSDFRAEPGGPADGPGGAALGSAVAGPRVPRRSRPRAGVRAGRGTHGA